MQRREILKILAAGAALPVFTPSVAAFFREAQAQVGAAYKPRTLNPQQNATVVAMVDLIIPATDTPGAKAARVNDFIDVILTEWATDTERQDFLNGLAGVDKQSNDLYGKNFTDASPSQQFALLRSMDDAIMAAHIERHRRHGNTVPEERDKQLRGDSFWYIFKSITLHGYYTSEIGFSQELNEQIIPGAFHGCVPLTVGKRA
jgi:gluconate 2-dehydrogenase gamma chain